MNKKHSKRVLITLAVLLLAPSWCCLAANPAKIAAKTIAGDRKLINGKEFALVWSDEFDGTQPVKWTDRISGYGYQKSFNTGDCFYLDGEGHLVLSLCAYPKAKIMERMKTPKEIEALSKAGEFVPVLAHKMTKDSFLYGYHEVRFKLPLISGPGFCFWFPGNDEKSPEIDVIEQTLFSKGIICDYKSSTVHWYPGGYNEKNHQYHSYQFHRPSKGKVVAAEMARQIILGTTNVIYNPKTPNIIDNSKDGLLRKVHLIEDDHFRWDDGQWHTVALLWLKDSYSFYYDGELVCKYTEGLRHVPAHAVLFLRIMGGQPQNGLADIIKSGKGDNAKDTPAKVLVDYYRVYKSDDTGNVVIPAKSN